MRKFQLRRLIRISHFSMLVALVLPPISRGGDLALLRIESAAASWGDVRLTPKLLDRLSGHNGLTIELMDDSMIDGAASGDGFFDTKGVMAVGVAAGARYVVSLSAVSTELRTKKGLSIPLIVSRYNTVGIISGVIRIVDTKMGRLVYDKDFSIERRAASEWQALEDNRQSPALDVSADEKPRFMEALEWQAAEELSHRILKVTINR